MTDHYKVIPEFDVPAYASGNLKGTMTATHAAIQSNVDNLGAGTPWAGPELTDLMYDAKLIDDQNRSVTTTNHNDAVTALQTIERQIERDNEAVDSSSYGAYTAAGDAYTDIDQAVERLRGLLKDSVALGPSYNEKGEAYWPESVEGPLISACASTMEVVEQRMQQATTDIQQHADHIDRSAPGNPTNNAYGGTPAPLTQPWSGTSYVPPADASLVEKIKGFAENELGVVEQGTNHVNRPYNINDAWCASFATWVWKQSGIDVDWSNKNLVRAVWSDGASQGLADSNMGAARPGDLVVFGGQNHIGVVVARNGDTITTIEGNSGDAVRQRTYNISSGNFTGVIHPPANDRTPARV
ncbi:CHAP domain-containing protein [Nocardia wallacei]|uniref:CHAP domain-containing protein n=1 Tax=Nocardia wallacei TaxID=480035 RepID=UPI002458E120|nr:CHAP domain-containing protein [Nocardia wallacei]